MVITNCAQSFHWAGYGFKLHIPQDSLPAGVDQCQLDIIASVAGQYQLPDNHELVSGVFWVRPNPPCRFQKQLTVEIQHSAKQASYAALAFVRASCAQESLPYTFKKLEGRGSFTKEGSFGSLDVNGFSAYAMAAPQPVEKLYIASLFNRSPNPGNIEIYFVITMDEPVHNQEAKKYCKDLGATEMSYLEVEFENNQIVLDIPLPDGVNVHEWTVIPLSELQISRERVDYYKPGRRVISRKLKANLPGDWTNKVPPRYHRITLQGAKEPNKMTIELDAFDPNSGNIQDSTSSSVVPYSKQSVAPSLPPLLNCKDVAGSSHLSLEQSHTSLTLSSMASHSLAAHTQGISERIAVGDGLLHGMAGTVGALRAIEYPQESSSHPDRVTLDQLVAHVGVEKDLLEEQCSMQLLMEVAPILPDWAALAKMLGFTERQIQDVNQGCQHLPSNSTVNALKMFEIWLERLAFKATYRCLVDACFRLGNVSTATEICEKLKQIHQTTENPAPVAGLKRKHEENDTEQDHQVDTKRQQTMRNSKEGGTD